jgi:integrase
MAKRRGRGEGSIRQRKDGRWEARISLEGGKRRSIFGVSRAAVAKRMVTDLKGQQDGLPVPGEQLTLGRHLTTWLEDIKNEVRPSTQESYERLVRLHVLPDLAKVRLVRLTPEHLRSLFNAKLASGLSLRTVRYIRAVLRSALQQALSEGKVGRNVAVLAKMRKQDDDGEPARIMKTLTRDQAKALLNAAAGDPLEALYVLAITTGMRQGELLGLRWPSVNLPKATLSVVGTLQRTPNGLQVMKPKTATSRRTIQLTAVAVAALRRRKGIQAEERIAVAEVWENTGLVFTNEIGRGIEKQNLLRRSFWPLLAGIGMAEVIPTTAKRRYGKKVKTVKVIKYKPAIRFHDLRHTAATLLLEQGTHPAVVAAMLGHSKTSTTLNIYSHVTPSIMGAARTAMEEILG